MAGVTDSASESDSRSHPLRLDDISTADNPTRTTTTLTVAGLIGMCMIAASGALVGPYGPTGSTLERRVTDVLPVGTAGTVLGTILLVLGLVLVFGAWILVGLALRKGAPLRPLIRMSVLWSLPLIVAPPLYSRDVYSYAALGKMVSHHLSPYHGGPARLGVSSFVPPVSSVWLHTRSPYGPVFISLASMATRLAGTSVVNAVILLRLLEVLGLVLIALGLPTLANAAGKDPARAIWLGICNPLVLVHFIGGAHNDALMVGLIVCGLALTYAGRPYLGVVACTLAAAVKAPGAIAVLFVVIHVLRATPPESRRKVLLRLSGVGAAVFLLATVVTGLGWGWIAALGVPGSTHVLLTPTIVLGRIASPILGRTVASAGATVVGYIALVVGLTYLVWRAPVLGTTRACGLALALLVVAGPIVLPWYALWAVVVLAPAGRRIERGFAILASVVLTLALEPSGAAMPDLMLILMVVALAAVAASINLPSVRRWIRNELAPAIDEYRQLGRLDRIPAIAVRILASSRPTRRRRGVPSLHPS